MAADPNSLSHFRAGQPTPFLRGKVDNLGLGFFRAGEPYGGLIVSVVIPPHFVDLAVNVTGNEADAGEWVCGTFLCGVDPNRVVVALTVTSLSIVSLSAAVAGQASVAAALAANRSLAAPVSGQAAVSGNFAGTVGLAASIAGAGVVSPALNVAKLVMFTAPIAGQGTVSIVALGLPINLASSVAGQAAVGASFVRTVGLAAVLDLGPAKLHPLISLNLLLTAPVAGVAVVNAKLIIVFLWPAVCDVLDLEPAVCDELELVGASSGTLTLTPSECR